MSPKVSLVQDKDQGKESKRKRGWSKASVKAAQEEQGSGRMNKLGIRPFTM